jgi:hypothetical protein
MHWIAVKTLCVCVAIAAMTSACKLYEQDAPCPCSSGWTCCPGAHVCAETADLCPMDPSDIQWQQTRSMAGTMPIAGVDSDGHGGLWIAYQPPGEVYVDHLDAAGHTLTEWMYPDALTAIRGLAFAGDSIWLNYAGLAPVDQDVRQLDATTGSEIQRFATSANVADLAAGTDELLLVQNDQMVTLDPTTGGVRARTALTHDHPGETRGIAEFGSLVWLATWDSDTVVLADRTGHVVRQGNIPYLGYPALRDVFLAWDGTSLIVEVGNQITWYTPQGQITP